MVGDSDLVNEETREAALPFIIQILKQDFQIVSQKVKVKRYYDVKLHVLGSKRILNKHLIIRLRWTKNFYNKKNSYEFGSESDNENQMPNIQNW